MHLQLRKVPIGVSIEMRSGLGFGKYEIRSIRKGKDSMSCSGGSCLYLPLTLTWLAISSTRVHPMQGRRGLSEGESCPPDLLRFRTLGRSSETPASRERRKIDAPLKRVLQTVSTFAGDLVRMTYWPGSCCV
jgi:hypothetical protein